LPVGGSDIAGLRKQARLLEGRVHQLSITESRLFPTYPAILVDTSENKITLIQGSRIIAQGTCSTGNGMELNDEGGKRSWTFDTPRGYFRVLGKVSNPVWYRPDWSFIEEGEPVPKDRSSRATPDVLGDYALSFGNGYFIHGTLYTRLLGTNVTHGCIRVDDDMLKKIYDIARPGTPIWIY
jgi:L,D-transpeptidase ErfK/SrfK